jgi:hypothetical protein
LRTDLGAARYRDYLVRVKLAAIVKTWVDSLVRPATTTESVLTSPACRLQQFAMMALLFLLMAIRSRETFTSPFP